MTNTLDSSPRDPVPSSTPPPPPPMTSPAAGHDTAEQHHARKRGAGHIVAIIAGCLLLLPGLGLFTGGGAVAFGQAVATDGDGYFRFTLDRLESGGVAIATTELWLDDVEGESSPWLFDFLDVDFRLRVDGAGQTDDVFVGIARSGDVERYLDGAAYSAMVGLNDHTPEYEQVLGATSVEAPTEQDFWTVSATGSGTQEIDWEARGGQWSVVVMNSDGTPLVAADVEIGARSGAVTPVAVALMVTGGVLVLAAGVMIIVGARGRRSSARNGAL